MCLAVPARLLAVEGAVGRVSLSGVTREISMMLLPEAKAGDFVLVHAGFAMQLVSEAEAQETEGLLAEMAGAPRTVGRIPGTVGS